jgi:hypothetical protein
LKTKVGYHADNSAYGVGHAASPVQSVAIHLPVHKAIQWLFTAYSLRLYTSTAETPKKSIA